MNPLLVFGSLAAARVRIRDALRRMARSFIAYAVLICAGLVVLGFFTAGAFIYITSLWGSVVASMIVAAAYAFLGGICFLAIALPGTASPTSQVRSLAAPKSRIERAVAVSPDLPGTVIAVGLLAVAGYLVGRSMTRRR